MYQTKIDGPNTGQIIDKKDFDIFGIQLHDAWVLEQFQELSGMSGPYTKEYQHHYINLVARMKQDRQELNIAIPLVLFNYEQIVGGAHVEFELEDVDDMQEEAMKIAEKKAKEVLNSAIGKYLTDIGFKNFEIHGYNNIHVHPGQLLSFSGTDYKKDINNPGVVFPLHDCKDAPIFSGIITHVNNYAQLGHMEFRIASKVKNNVIYKHGRCLTIIRGYEEEIDEQEYEIKEPGIFDRMFGTTPPPPPPPPQPRKVSNRWLVNQMHDADKDILKQRIEELLNIWNETEFYPDISMIKKSNILTSKPVQVGFTRGINNQQTLFGYSTHRAKKNQKSNEKEEEEKEPNVYEMEKYLMSKGYSTHDIVSFTNKELEDTYWVERLDEHEESKAKVSIYEMKKELVQENMFTYSELFEFDDAEIEDLYESLCEIRGE